MAYTKVPGSKKRIAKGNLFSTHVDFTLYANSEPVYLSQGGLYKQDASLWRTNRTTGTLYKDYAYSSTVVGSADNDVIYGLNKNIKVDSTNKYYNPVNFAHETISGELGDDVIYGYGGWDILYGDDINNSPIEGGNRCSLWWRGK